MTKKQDLILPLIAVLFFFLIPGTAFAETITFTSASTDFDNIGSGSRSKMARKFTPSADSDTQTIHLFLTKNSSPDGTYTISIQGDSGGNPSGTPLDDFTESASNLTTNACGSNAEDFTLNASLTGSTAYWIVIERSSLAVGYVQVCHNYGVSSTLLYWKDGGAWYQWTNAEIRGSIELTETGGGEPESTWCGIDVLSTTTPTCAPLGVDACGNIVCMATTTADITAISVTLLNALVFIVAFISVAVSLWIFKLLIR